MQKLINDDEAMHNVDVLVQKISGSMTPLQKSRIDLYREIRNERKELEAKVAIAKKGGAL